MTDHHDLKVQIKARMAVAEETYATARKHVLAGKPDELLTDRFLLGNERSTAGMDLVVIGSPKPPLVLLPNIERSKDPCLIVATPELFRQTCGLRRALGPVLVFDPREELKGDLPKEKGYRRLSFSPFADCLTLDPQTGQRQPSFDECWKSASWLSEGLASKGSNSQDWEYWASSARQLLSGYLYAANLAGLTLLEVYGWITAQDTETAIKIITDASRTEDLPVYDTTAATNMLKGIDGRPDKERATCFSTVSTLMGIFSESAVIRSTMTSNFTIEELLAPGATTYLIRAPWGNSGVNLITAFFNYVITKNCQTPRPSVPPLRVFLPSQDSLTMETLTNNRRDLRFFFQLDDVASLVENGRGKTLKQILQQHEILLLPGSITAGSLSEVLQDLPLDRLPKISPEAYDNYLIPLEGSPRVVHFD